MLPDPFAPAVRAAPDRSDGPSYAEEPHEGPLDARWSTRSTLLRDRQVVLLAAATTFGAWRGGGPALAVALGVVALGCVVRRPVVLALALACLAATLADRALAGLDPVEAGPVDGWVRLVGDPAPIDGGGVRVDVVVEGRRVEASAFGRPAGDLERRLDRARCQLRRSDRRHPGWQRRR